MLSFIGEAGISCNCSIISYLFICFIISYLFFISFSLPGGADLFLRFFIRLLLVVYIILIHSLQLLGYFNHYIIKYSIVPESWLDSIRAYRVNKHLGILTPRHERRYFRILATIENSLTFSVNNGYGDSSDGKDDL